MRALILMLTLISFATSDQYTFLINKYNKEMELEAKIIANIATLATKGEIKLFIPNISKVEKKVYSKIFTLVDKCEKSNFVFVKKNIKIDPKCLNNKRLFFTNNYKKLLNKDIYFGAFFWSKSRPNIVFIKNRLRTKKILLPKSYNKFIEDF
ncbi:hypothetical protein [Malaciobacter marinus]|uniref:Uncharacterized protein n=1 Tax=Malaciobacter marinus TaxID=505249 RepID=A0A347TLL0_9BACT|nr:MULTISPECIES: hypothetical protein [Malaciobacter]AXX87488.1 hypothetical protein AMRN_1760 [Malaciobacter marinus]PHO16151.1 hypothetical protein CPH92_02955 [Malaciobacter marinus]RYA23587.1 hypothetical protein CRU96_07345 [Malaciobacter halophilus]